MPEVTVCGIVTPAGSPVPTYNPSKRVISTIALDATETMSTGRVSQSGRPPTPIPMLACTGMSAISTQAFVMVIARDRFQGMVLFVTVLTAGPKIVAPAG